MHIRGKRFMAWLLLLALVASLLPAPQRVGATALEQSAYASADSVFDQIDAMEAQPAKKAATQTQKTDAAAALVMETDSYVEGSLERNGDSFTWWTDTGVRCVYSPRMRKIGADLSQTGEDRIENEPVAVKGGSATGNQVYLIGPYYGYDSDFTRQYRNEASRVAAAIGDTDGYTLYSGMAATVDKVAKAISNGAVVFFDSHGITDYENGDDFVTGAENSYLCLTSTTGLTDQDYDDGALYYSDGICINGATIANHMQSNSPGGFLWMAICLGMATDTICEPLRQKGVEVVYGYSQSVTFDGDYLYEETFWGEMIKSRTVAQSIATMKDTWGNWDWSTQMANYYYSYDGYATISAARRDYVAFPVVVSDEDAFPGQRSRTSYGACSLQTVQSTYTLNVVAEAPDTPTGPEVPAGAAATITFDDLDKRTELSTERQVWEENGITVVNQRSANSSLINGVYYNPVRFYSGSTLKVTYPGMVKLEMDCSSTQHASAFSKAVTAMYDANVTDVVTRGNVVTVIFAKAVDDFEVDLVSGQTRAKWITVYAAQPEEEPEQPEIIVGDLDGVAGVTEDDAIYLLQYVLLPEQLPATQNMDFDKSGIVDLDDVIYLLQHVLLPNVFPL